MRSNGGRAREGEAGKSVLNKAQQKAIIRELIKMVKAVLLHQRALTTYKGRSHDLQLNTSVYPWLSSLNHKKFAEGLARVLPENYSTSRLSKSRLSKNDVNVILMICDVLRGLSDPYKRTGALSSILDSADARRAEKFVAAIQAFQQRMSRLVNSSTSETLETYQLLAGDGVNIQLKGTRREKHDVSSPFYRAYQEFNECVETQLYPVRADTLGAADAGMTPPPFAPGSEDGAPSAPTIDGQAEAQSVLNANQQTGLFLKGRDVLQQYLIHARALNGGRDLVMSTASSEEVSVYELGDEAFVREFKGILNREKGGSHKGRIRLASDRKNVVFALWRMLDILHKANDSDTLVTITVKRARAFAEILNKLRTTKTSSDEVIVVPVLDDGTVQSEPDAILKGLLGPTGRSKLAELLGELENAIRQQCDISDARATAVRDTLLGRSAGSSAAAVPASYAGGYGSMFPAVPSGARSYPGGSDALVDAHAAPPAYAPGYVAYDANYVEGLQALLLPLLLSKYVEQVREDVREPSAKLVAHIRQVLSGARAEQINPVLQRVRTELGNPVELPSLLTRENLLQAIGGAPLAATPGAAEADGEGGVPAPSAPPATPGDTVYG